MTECTAQALEFGHFRQAIAPARQRKLSLLTIERGSCGPKGQKSLAQGLPWVLGLPAIALKGRPLARHPTKTSPNLGAPSGLLTSEPFPRVNPGLGSHGPLGRRLYLHRSFRQCPNRTAREKRILIEEALTFGPATEN
jgi:hypothetical protein